MNLPDPGNAVLLPQPVIVVEPDLAPTAAVVTEPCETSVQSGDVAVTSSTVIPTGDITMDGILIINPKETESVIAFAIDDRPFELESGANQALRLVDTDQVIISFDRGGDFGLGQNTLEPGSYEFQLTDRGWELLQVTFRVTIDNSDFPGTFGYMAAGEEFAVEAGLSHEHRSDFPLEVSFDPGDGSEPVCQFFETGTYTVHINVERGRIELVTVDDVQVEVAATER